MAPHRGESSAGITAQIFPSLGTIIKLPA